jgi:hypothetical protein
MAQTRSEVASRSWMSLAPALPRNQRSLPAIDKAAASRGGLPSNKQPFLCLHNVQAPRMTIELRPFCMSKGREEEAFLHQSRKEISPSCRARTARPIRLTKKNQNCLEKNARHKEMVQSFRSLVTQDTCLMVGQAPPLEPISWPASVVSH